MLDIRMLLLVIKPNIKCYNVNYLNYRKFLMEYGINVITKCAKCYMKTTDMQYLMH